MPSQVDSTGPKSSSSRRRKWLMWHSIALLGTVVVLSIWQNEGMLQYSKAVPLVFDQLSALSQDNNMTLQSPLLTNENDWDLVLWSSNRPVFREGVDPSSLVVSRKFSRDVDELLSTMDEVIRVDFRQCHDGNCPTTVSPDFRDTELGPEVAAQYQRNEDRVLEFLFIHNVGEKSKNGLSLDDTEAVTFWSHAHKRHIPVDYPRERMTVASCVLHRTCPEPCTENRKPRQQPQEEPDHWIHHPYVRDPIDKICKSSHPDAIPPARAFGGKCGCLSTCYTPDAGALNSTWPWKDAAERNSFYPHWKEAINRGKASGQLSKRALARRRKEGRNYNTYQARFACRNNQQQEPTSASIKPGPIFGDFQHHLFFVPEAKLVFCGIPKVGVTEWVKFFRHVMGAKDYLSLPHYKVDRNYFLMSTLDSSKAAQLLNDPSWTKAVFFRNPFERLLSAYMDKIVGHSYTQLVFKIGDESTSRKANRPVLTFAEFIDRIADKNATTNHECDNPNGLGACTDPHWKPQVMTCGLDHLLPAFDFIGSFDFISEHTRILLERVGLWEKYGTTFDDGKDVKNKYHMCSVPPPQRGTTSNETLWGFNQRGPSGVGKNVHATGSQSRFSELYTPELMAKVREAYALDFAVWDEISSKDRTVDEIANGKDLKVVRQYCTVLRNITSSLS